MYCIGTIKQLKYVYFGIQEVFITPLPYVYNAAWLSKRPGKVWNCAYVEMHLKNLLGSIAREEYCIPFPEF